MNLYQRVARLLEEEPRARERRWKDRGIRMLLIEKYPCLEDIPKPILISALRSYASYDRAWRKVTEENPELRGEDYLDKFQLEKREKQRLGYEIRNINLDATHEPTNQKLL